MPPAAADGRRATMAWPGGWPGWAAVAAHPERAVLALSAAAWLVLVVQPAAGGIALCGDPALGALHGESDRLLAGWQAGGPPLGRRLLGWMVMTVAMMLPLVGATLRQVAGRSFAARRGRAAGGFLAGYLAAWALLGVALLPVAAAAAGWVAPAAGFLLAASWQLTPLKARALRRCHRTLPLAPWGWRADRDCIRFGIVHATACAASCGPMMLACLLPAHTLLPMACAQAAAVAERRSRMPAPGRSAVALAACALLC